MEGDHLLVVRELEIALVRWKAKINFRPLEARRNVVENTKGIVKHDRQGGGANV